MQELRKHNFFTDSEVDALKTDINDVANQPCIANKVSYLVAFWFDLPMPTPNQGNFQRRIYDPKKHLLCRFFCKNSCRLKAITIFAKKLSQRFDRVPNTTGWKVSVFGLFLVLIFQHSDWIQKDAPCLSAFSPNKGKYGPEKLRIRTLFTQCTLLTLFGLFCFWLCHSDYDPLQMTWSAESYIEIFHKVKFMKKMNDLIS